jgi:hypothetical protein
MQKDHENFTVHQLAVRYDMTPAHCAALLFNLDMVKSGRSRHDATDTHSGVAWGLSASLLALKEGFLWRDRQHGFTIAERGITFIDAHVSEAINAGPVCSTSPAAVQSAFIAAEEDHSQRFGLSYLLLPCKSVRKKLAKGWTTQRVADYFRVPADVISFMHWSKYPTLIDPRKASAWRARQ